MQPLLSSTLCDSRIIKSKWVLPLGSPSEATALHQTSRLQQIIISYVFLRIANPQHEAQLVSLFAQGVGASEGKRIHSTFSRTTVA